MAVLTIGAVPSLGARRRTVTPAAKTSAAVRVATAPRVVSSSSGLPGAYVVPAPPKPTISFGRQRESAERRAAVRAVSAASMPAPAPAPSSTSVLSRSHVSADYGAAPSGGGGGGGGGGTASGGYEAAGDAGGGSGAPSDDGIPKWAAIGAIAVCAIVGLAVLHRQGVI